MKIFLAIILLALFFADCKKEESNPVYISSGTMTATVNGANWNAGGGVELFEYYDSPDTDGHVLTFIAHKAFADPEIFSISSAYYEGTYTTSNKLGIEYLINDSMSYTSVLSQNCIVTIHRTLIYTRPPYIIPDYDYALTFSGALFNEDQSDSVVISNANLNFNWILQ
jgi:hypothetical protein